MQDGTYPSRNFATFGPLWLQPPFTGDSILSCELILLTFQHRAGVRPYTSSYEFAESCVFSKQSLLPIMCHLFRYSLFRSYRAILPSSFNIVLSKALVHLYQFTSVGLGYGSYWSYFQNDRKRSNKSGKLNLFFLIVTFNKCYSHSHQYRLSPFF